MEQSKIELIYQIITKKLPLTNQTLIDNGFSKEEIECLLEQKILECVSSSEYKLSDVKGLYNYAVKLSFLGKIKDAYLSFLKCYELDNNNKEACLQLILYAVKIDHYNEVFVL